MSVGVARNIVRRIVGSWLRGPRTHYLFENHDDPREFGPHPDGADVTIVGGAGVDPASIPLTPEPPAPPVKVAVVSRMIAFKGIAEAVAAVQRARADGAAIELHLFGDPDPANRRSIPEVHAAALGVGAGNHVAWPRCRRRAGLARPSCRDAIVLPGGPATQPRRSCRRTAIVTTDVPGCREVVRNGVEGFLVPCGDTDAAARALATLAADPALRAKFGVAANTRFQLLFTAEAVKQTVSRLTNHWACHPDDTH